MSLNSAVQQLAAGLAAAAGGALLRDTAAGLEGYWLAGALAVAATLASVVLAGRLRPAPEGAEAVDAAAVHAAGLAAEPAETLACEAADLAFHFRGPARPSEAVTDRGAVSAGPE
jgi:hypothetical protein